MLDVTDIARDIIGTILGLHNSKSYKLISSIQRHIHVISRTLIRDVMIELKQLPMKILILHLSIQEALYGH